MPVDEYTDDEGTEHITITGSHTTIEIEKDEDGHTSVSVSYDYD